MLTTWTRLAGQQDVHNGMFMATGCVYRGVCVCWYFILCGMNKGEESWYSMCKKTVFMCACLLLMMCVCALACQCVHLCMCTFLCACKVRACVKGDGDCAAAYIWIIGRNEGEHLVWMEPPATSQRNYCNTAAMEGLGVRGWAGWTTYLSPHKSTIKLGKAEVEKDIWLSITSRTRRVKIVMGECEQQWIMGGEYRDGEDEG